MKLRWSKMQVKKKKELKEKTKTWKISLLALNNLVPRIPPTPHPGKKEKALRTRLTHYFQ